MSITQQLNSKVNIKKKTAADLPFNPKQPVMNEYKAESTDGQTVINLPWMVDTVNAQSAFFLFVDGKKLSFGASGDYTMTSVDSLGFSSQVTLTQSISGIVNIEAYKLGLKKETEWAQDQRFVDLYDVQENSFQAFVKKEWMTPTTNTGTPAAGTFHSTVIGRKPMVDLSKDLKPRMGVERILVQQLVQLNDEFGSLGEIVKSPVNDSFGQIRFVGAWGSGTVGVHGQYIPTTTVGDYVEVTFYGTGLNGLLFANNDARDARVSVNGGSEGSNIYAGATSSAILAGRNYTQNTIYPLVSGLTLGVHTVKLRVNAVATSVFGFEILNESSSVKTNAGTSYVQGKKLVNSIQNVTAYNTGVTGTRGGRMLVYQASDGSISRSFQAVNGAAAYLTNADHTNEEVARVYHWREFGASRNAGNAGQAADDFSSLTATASTRAFTLDDGTTTLIGQSARDGGDGSVYSNATSDYFTFTFVGCGLDIILSPNVAGGGSIYVDGTLVTGTGNTAWAANKSSIKVVSGLPYGTHTVRLTREALPAFLLPKQFVVYQPKKPALPSGAVELADYNVMATYSATTSSTLSSGGFMSTGVLYKMNTREMMYVGSGWNVNATVNSGAPISGIRIDTPTSGDYVQYSFFGTGVEGGIQFNAAGGQAVQVYLGLNGATPTLYTGALTLASPSNVTWTPGTSTIANSAVAQTTFQITGLALGFHTIRLAKSNATGALLFESFSVITPIHSHASKSPFDLQNTLPIGSLGISDNRAMTPVKDVVVKAKNISQAVGFVVNPTNSSASFLPVPDLSVTHYNTTGRVRVSFSVNVSNSTIGQSTEAIAVMNGVDFVTPNTGFISAAVGQTGQLVTSAIVNVSPGFNKFDVFWNVTAGTATATASRRNLVVEEVD